MDVHQQNMTSVWNRRAIETPFGRNEQHVHQARTHRLGNPRRKRWTIILEKPSLEGIDPLSSNVYKQSKAYVEHVLTNELKPTGAK